MKKEELAARLRALKPWQRYTWYPGGDMDYQSCRFCHLHATSGFGLWKYGVRHYICDRCKEEKQGK